MENVYTQTEKEIKDNLDKMVSGYFKEFLNKFDNFNNQLKVTELLLKAYQYRYDKYKEKLNSVSDILKDNNEEQKELEQKIEKLDKIAIQMTEIETKLYTLNKRVGTIEGKLLDK